MLIRVKLDENYFMKFFSSFSFEKLETLDISNLHGVTKQVVFMTLKIIPNPKKIKVDSRVHERTEIVEMIASSDILGYLDFISWSGSNCIVRVLLGVLTW